ncbi:MAG: hypothetical protein LW817_08725 [Candidatus Caenarcaniphilales bacterium]|jgi:undecaprenyl pyrophosphate synthase|nr:hypothetical protein [Candidatus Caenarcaniphilales bacterium]
MFTDNCNQIKSIALICPELDSKQAEAFIDHLKKYSGLVDFLESNKGSIELEQKAQKLIDQNEVITEDQVQNLETQYDLIIVIAPELRLYDAISLGASYSEIHHISKKLSETSIQDLDLAVEDFWERQRNFGV